MKHSSDKRTRKRFDSQEKVGNIIALMKPEADSAYLHAQNRRLAAIMFTDIVGFSRQMGAARYLHILGAHLTLAAVYSELGQRR